jgi:hypothetical protein
VKLPPDRLRPRRIFADNLWKDVALEELDDGTASGADRVGIARPGRTVAALYVNKDRLLLDKGLDGIGSWPLDGNIAEEGAGLRNLHSWSSPYSYIVHDNG